MIKDRVALDLPFYDGLLAGYYDKGAGYVSRRAEGTDDWLLIASLSGMGRFGSGEGEFEAGPGSLVLISPGTAHDYGTARGSDRWELLWVHFQPPSEWLEILSWPSSMLAPSASSRPSIEAAFREVLRISISATHRRRQFAMNALERLLLLCEAELPAAGEPLDDRVRIAIDYIHAHLHARITLASLSSRVHLSAGRFAHLFRDQTGLPPLEYVALQRMRRAQILLERTTLSIHEIAAEVGMEPFHFSSRFKAHTGRNPRAYRSQNSRTSSSSL